MARVLKTFNQIQPQNLEKAAPKSNSLSLDLAGLNLTDAHLAQIRQAAVKAAMSAAAQIVGKGGGVLSDSFSTFSTFSTFGSGSTIGRPEILTAESGSLIDRVVG